MNHGPQFRVTATLDGYLKVKLFFQTWESKHIRSQVLETDFRVQPPFTEDISVLLPPEAVFHRLSCFEDVFRALKEAEILALTDKLQSFEVRDEDTRTLAYYEVMD